ncbi:aldolase [Schizophyllum commune H4-8]|uniref:Transaldolase n=1 Tax=Schizophyllum commune (strain H4-8 / FGSC 9210) TaxID=578458 RepID=D8QLP0_SCHCM|nr:aldolase [Schizophyllum commune H4-8]KAI5884983.1 aldolase [Schizophyllum commune H4-8]
MVSQLEYLETLLNVDVDHMHPSVAKSLPFKPHDQTSNQLIVNEQIELPENRELLEKAVKEYGSKGWSAVLDRLSVQLCAKNLPNIQGRVLLQTSPFHAYDKDKVVEHARSYAREFEKVGISRDRFCIKVPCTGPAMNAAKILNAEGIRTLGTSLFGLPQAIASSQSDCLYISPYFNEVRAHADLSLWPNVEDPATQHTMAPRMIHILETYKRLAKETGKEQPMVKSASFISAKEALACGEMGCQSATPSAEVLAELLKTPADKPVSNKPRPAYSYLTVGPTPERLRALLSVDPLAAADWDGKLASTDIDYLANNGEELEKAIERDPITKNRLYDALELFKGGELKSKALIEKVMAEQK